MKKEKANHLKALTLFRVTVIIALITGVITSLTGQWKPAIDAHRIDSLENRLTATRGTQERYELSIELATALLDTLPDKSIELCSAALRDLESEKLQPDYKVYRVLGNAYERKGDIFEAIEQIRKSGELLEEADDPGLLASYYNYLGYLYQRMGNYFNSIECYFEARSMAEEAGARNEMARANYGLAISYGSIGNSEAELNFYKTFLEVADPSTEQRRMSVAYMMWADKVRQNNQFEEAIGLYNKAYDKAREINDSVHMALVMNHLAWTFYQKGELQTSLEYYRKNLDFSIPLNQKGSISNIYGNIGNIYRDLQDYESALDYYSKSIEVSTEISDYYNLSWIYNDMTRMYAMLGDYEKAYEFSRLHSQFNDSLLNMRYQSRLGEAQARYEAEKSQKELEIVSLKLRNNRIIILSLIAFSIILITGAFLLFQRNRYRSNQRIEAMNLRISELNQQNLRQQMNPHFIFNTLNSIQYYVFRQDKIAANDYMSKFATLMRKTLENSRQTAISINDELDALKLYLELESLRFKHRFEWNIEVDNEIDTLLYKIPTMLIQPYVENSISHGLMQKEGKGYVHISLRQVEGSMMCTVEDNGIGRAKAAEIKKQRKGQHNSLGTKITESRLKLVNELYGNTMQVNYVDKVDIDGNASGTRVEITIPIIT